MKISDYITKEVQVIVRRICELFSAQKVEIYQGKQLLIAFKPKK